MVHHDERPANGFVCGSFFALCVMERLAHGAPSPTGRARAAPRYGLHSPRGDRSLIVHHTEKSERILFVDAFGFVFL